jgi:hypothetical protein
VKETVEEIPPERTTEGGITPAVPHLEFMVVRKGKMIPWTHPIMDLRGQDHVSNQSAICGQRI